MKTKLRLVAVVLVVVATIDTELSTTFAQGTAFTYQGRLTSGTNAANGSYDFRFILYEQSTGQNPSPEPPNNGLMTVLAVGVTNGLFTATLDFGANFYGPDRWLEISVRTNATLTYTTLSPRQKITPAPYSIFSAHADSAFSADSLSGTLPANQLTGTVPDARLSNNIARLNLNQTFTGTITAGGFTGNGAGLTNLNLVGPPAGVTPILNMVWIVPGTFVMGSPASELDRSSDEGPQTVVTLTKGFWMGHHAVTQGEYLAVMNTNPSYFAGNLSLPVEQVSWNDATNFCATLTQRELNAGRLPAGWVYRLPTEAEWEYACRALTTTRFYYGDDLTYSSLTNYAWYGVNSGGAPHPVGQKLANPWGFVDMGGNLREWCRDWYGAYPGGSVTDPQGPGTGSYRINRGGWWFGSPQYSRSAFRAANSPTTPGWIFGIRAVLAPGQP